MPESAAFMLRFLVLLRSIEVVRQNGSFFYELALLALLFVVWWWCLLSLTTLPCHGTHSGSPCNQRWTFSLSTNVEWVLQSSWKEGELLDWSVQWWKRPKHDVNTNKSKQLLFTTTMTMREKSVKRNKTFHVLCKWIKRKKLFISKKKEYLRLILKQPHTRTHKSGLYFHLPWNSNQSKP